MLKAPLIFIYFLFIILVPHLILAQDKSSEKKLIEFGWDSPSVSALKDNLSQREKTPFDGVCFSFDYNRYTAFDTARYADSKFQYTDLSKIQWGKFTDNFLIVRGAGRTGARWLDDRSWANISQNIKKISKALDIAKAKGIAFDPEYYFKDSTLNPWKYAASWYNNLSYQEVGNYVRKRGQQFIQALQTYKPDVKILCLWLLGWVYVQNQTHPIEETNMALYPFFVEGMLEGKNNSSEIIDGNESAYTYQSFMPFVRTGVNTRENQRKLINKSLHSKFKQVSVAQSVFFDYLYAKLPKYDKGFDKQTKEQWLKDNLYFAFKTTDKYVWFYNQKINWWKNEIDPGVTEIITAVKDKINSELNSNSIETTGKLSILNFKRKQGSSYQGVSYNYIKAKKLLEIKVLKNDIKNLQIYKNSFLIYNVNDPTTNFTVDLNGKYNTGNLIIMAKDSKGIFSVSFVN